MPIQVLEGESIPEGIPELLADAHVVLLGYHAIPEQTAPDQAREEFGERATRKLEELAGGLENAGATVDTRLVFTHKAQTSIDRVGKETDSLAILVPNAPGDLERVLVALRGTVGSDRLARLVTGLFGESEVGLTLFHVVEEPETEADAETLLEGMVERLADGGVEESRIDSRIVSGGDPADVIAEAAEAHDVVVMGETDPTVVTYFFGMPAEKVAERFLGPVLVVQREAERSEASD